MVTMTHPDRAHSWGQWVLTVAGNDDHGVVCRR